MDWQTVTAELRKDLDRKHVKPPKQFGPKGDYIEAWWAQAEANRIFGHDGWHQEVTETRCVMEKSRPIGRDKKVGWGVTYTAKVRILVDGVCREDFGAGHGYDLDLGLAHESAIKEAVSDAMKRALKSFGWPFGLALYDKGKAHVGNGEDRNADFTHEPDPKLHQALIPECRAILGGSTTSAVALKAAWQTVQSRCKQAGLTEMPPALIAYKDELKAQMDAQMKENAEDFV